MNTEKEIEVLIRFPKIVELLQSYEEATKEAGYIPTVHQLIEDLLEQEKLDNPTE